VSPPDVDGHRPTPAERPSLDARAGAVFAALADDTRRQLLRSVVDQGPSTATALSAALPVTRQAVARHLGILRRAGLVRAERAGRETRYEADTASLRSAAEWIDQTGAAWDDRLHRLRAQVETRPDV
jgi:DNA-binding transcriptional ArsR family regulator